MPFLSDINFSGNQITQFAVSWSCLLNKQCLQSSSIALVGSLRYLNLSSNQISGISCDTAQPLPAVSVLKSFSIETIQMEVLDLSNNLIANMITTELKDFTGLRLLNLSGNPIELAGDRYITMESLKVCFFFITRNQLIWGSWSNKHEVESNRIWSIFLPFRPPHPPFE